ncbi:MAG: ATP-binding protein [Fulvivirga sp.]
MKDPLNILVVEDCVDDYDLLVRKLEQDKITVKSQRVEEEDDLIESLESNSFDIVISDNTLPKIDAKRALKVVRSLDQNIPFIIVSGTIPEKAAIESMYKGANDFLLKDNLSKLTPTVLREVKEARIRTEKIQVENKLLQSEQSFQSLAQSITDVFYALDTNLRVVYWNDAAHREFNIKKEDALGTLLYDLFPTFKHSRIHKEFIKGIREQKARYTTFKYSKIVDGIEFIEYYEGSIYPSTSGSSVILKKVTEQKLAEASLNKTNKELETLIYRLSHDIQGPLSSIMGLIGLGKMECNQHNVLDLFERQEEAARELNKTIKALMTISELKKEKLTPQIITFKSAVDNVINRLKFQPGFNHIQTMIDVDPSHEIVTDRTLVETILQQLIENSIKYRRVEGSALTIEAIKLNKCIYLTIYDNGMGIPLEQQNKVFSMFYRANENSKGPGLGLYLVRSSIDRLKGTIRMKSELGKGCRFDIILPDLQEQHAEHQAKAMG